MIKNKSFDRKHTPGFATSIQANRVAGAQLFA
jgi:hypothetical protein